MGAEREEVGVELGVGREEGIVTTMKRLAGGDERVAEEEVAGSVVCRTLSFSFAS